MTFVESLVHTEGCAEGYGESALDGMKNYDRVAMGHMLHPFSRFVFMVEHGCEKSLLSYFDLHFREDCGIIPSLIRTKHSLNIFIDKPFRFIFFLHFFQESKNFSYET